MTDRDIGPLVDPVDLSSAVGLLTRLPIPVDGETATQRGAAAAWAYPVAGFVIAVICAFVGAAMLWLSVPAGLTAGVVLVTGIFVTGALHEDGLADTVDGFWGGWDRTRRLEIMKDSRIGAYGVTALVLSLLLRWQGLTVAIGADLLWPALIVVAMISRAAMVTVMWWLPHARDTGLSHAVGRPATGTAQIAGLLAVLGGLLLGAWVIALVIVATLAALTVGWIAKAKIGGQTGDILGAVQQVVEITLWLTIAALVS